MFLRRGYRVDEADDEGVTAVDLARENNHQESVDLLLGTGDLGSDVKFDLRVSPYLEMISACLK